MNLLVYVIGVCYWFILLVYFIGVCYWCMLLVYVIGVCYHPALDACLCIGLYFDTFNIGAT